MKLLDIKPVDNWKTILLKAWSAYGLYLQIVLGLINDYAIPWAQGRGLLNAPGYGTLVATVALATLLLRILPQFLPLIAKSNT